VNSEDGLEALRERGELRTVAEVEKMIISKQKFKNRFYTIVLIEFLNLVEKMIGCTIC
jgi:hypothetical protein